MCSKFQNLINCHREINKEVIYLRLGSVYKQASCSRSIDSAQHSSMRRLPYTLISKDVCIKQCMINIHEYI